MTNRISATVHSSPIQITTPENKVAVRVVGQPGPAGPSGAQGPQGIQGPPGAAAVGYLHTQASESATWTIAHNLGFRPAVAPVSVGGVEMIGSITHLSDNTLQIDFLTPVAGSARLV